MSFPGKVAKVVFLHLTRHSVLRSNKGFTALESLLILLIFIGVAALFPFIYQSISLIDQELGEGRRSEWELFVIQLRKELHLSRSAEPKADKLTYLYGEDSISIEKYKQGVRRRVSGKGHEIMLQEVSSILFRQCGLSVCVQVLFVNGQREEAKLHVFDGEGL